MKTTNDKNIIRSQAEKEAERSYQLNPLVVNEVATTTAIETDDLGIWKQALSFAIEDFVEAGESDETGFYTSGIPILEHWLSKVSQQESAIDVSVSWRDTTYLVTCFELFAIHSSDNGQHELASRSFVYAQALKINTNHYGYAERLTQLWTEEPVGDENMSDLHEI